AARDPAARKRRGSRRLPGRHRAARRRPRVPAHHERQRRRRDPRRRPGPRLAPGPADAPGRGAGREADRHRRVRDALGGLDVRAAPRPVHPGRLPLEVDMAPAIDRILEPVEQNLPVEIPRPEDPTVTLATVPDAPLLTGLSAVSPWAQWAGPVALGLLVL